MTSLEKVRDHTTLCRFRNLLMSQNLWDKILNLINDQREGKGLKVKHSQGAIVDATLIGSAAHISESELKEIIEDRQDKRLYGDKGYASQSNKEMWRAKKTKNGLMEKAKRNKPLSSW